MHQNVFFVEWSVHFTKTLVQGLVWNWQLEYSTQNRDRRESGNGFWLINTKGPSHYRPTQTVIETHENTMRNERESQTEGQARRCRPGQQGLVNREQGATHVYTHADTHTHKRDSLRQSSQPKKGVVIIWRPKIFQSSVYNFCRWLDLATSLKMMSEIGNELVDWQCFVGDFLFFRWGLAQRNFKNYNTNRLGRVRLSSRRHGNVAWESNSTT